MRPPRARQLSFARGVLAFLGTLGSACSLTSLEGFSTKPTGGGADVQGASEGGADARDPETDGAPANTYAAAVREDGPVGYWRFEETTGDRLHDEIGQNDAVVAGACVLGVAGAPAIGGQAVRFDGTSCRLDVGSGFAFPSQDPFTIELWVRRTSHDFQHLFTRQERSPDSPINGYALVINTEGETYFERVVDETIDATNPVPVPSGSFVHLVATFDGKEMVVYIDGVARIREADTSSIPSIRARAVIGGKAQGGGWFSGELDEVAIYAKALSVERIAVHHTVGSAR